MSTPGRTRKKSVYTLFAAVLLAMVSPGVFSDDEESQGWFQDSPPDEPWQEQQGELPAYPEKGNLLELNISTGSQPYTLYIDTRSVRPDEDFVVRYTVVMISASGVWNISNEGLHCGERKVRRYAYGFDGEWQKLDDSPWKVLSGHGIYQYRRQFYNNYMCTQTQPYKTARQIIRKLRSSDYGYDE